MTINVKTPPHTILGSSLLYFPKINIKILGNAPMIEQINMAIINHQASE